MEIAQINYFRNSRIVTQTFKKEIINQRRPILHYTKHIDMRFALGVKCKENQKTLNKNQTQLKSQIQTENLSILFNYIYAAKVYNGTYVCVYKIICQLTVVIKSWNVYFLTKKTNPVTCQIIFT